MTEYLTAAQLAERTGYSVRHKSVLDFTASGTLGSIQAPNVHFATARPGRMEMALRSTGLVVLTLLIGFGVLVGMLVICGFAAVFWVLGRIWRGLR